MLRMGVALILSIHGCHLVTAPKAASISLLPASDAGRVRALLLVVTRRRRVALAAVRVSV